MQIDIRINILAKTRDKGCVDRYPVHDGILQFIGHYRDVLRHPVNVAKSEFDKLDIFLFDILHKLIQRAIHFYTPPVSFLLFAA